MRKMQNHSNYAIAMYDHIGTQDPEMLTFRKEDIIVITKFFFFFFFILPFYFFK